MKKQFILVFALMTLFAACNNSAKKDEAVTTEKTETDNTTASSSTDIVTADDGQKRMEELRKLSPISNETLKSFFPAEVNGMKRSSFNVANTLGYAVGTAEYKKDDTTNYSVAIYDCAGEAGAAFYSMSYLARMNLEREDDNGYEKTITYKGTNAMESFDKSSHQHRLHFVAGERFWVSVEGNEGLDNLKSFADALGLDKLNGVK
jgi:hypothetical protein